MRGRRKMVRVSVIVGKGRRRGQNEKEGMKSEKEKKDRV